MIRFLLVLFLPTPSMHGYASTQNENKSPEKRKRSMLDDDPCLDAQQVNDRESVEFLPRYVKLSRPWLRSDVTPKIFTSSGLRYQWTWAKSLAVRGLQNDTTIDDVLRYLDGHDCLFLAIGHAVWQSVQRARPVRIEGEISCSIPYAHSICVQRYGMEACSLYPNSGNDNQFRLEIGDGTYNRSKHLVYSEPLVLFEWGSTLLLPTLRWSYTVMTMAIYDNTIGQVYLVDMTGRGYADTCGKSLAAVVEDTMWSEWADEDIAKAYQFYLLRTMGFAVSNHELQVFVNKVIESKHTKKAAQAFYCESILHGAVSLADENLTTTCHLIYPDHFARKQLAKAKEILQKEMGEHWEEFMVEAIDEMEAVYLTEQQFIEVRKHKKSRVPKGKLRFTVMSMNETSHISRTPIRTITENGDGSPKYFERVNKLLSHDEQPHHDDISLTATGLDSLPTSSIEQHMPRTTNMDSLEKKANRSNSAHSAEFVTPIRYSPRSQSSDIVFQLLVFASATLILF